MFVSVNDEGVNVQGVVNIADYKGITVFPNHVFDDTYDLKCERIREAARQPWIYDKLLWIGRVYKQNKIRNKLMTLRNDRYEFINYDGTNAISHPEHCKYRYLLDVEGGVSDSAPTGFSERVSFLVHSGRLLL